MVKNQPVFFCCKGCESEAKSHPDETLLQFQKLMNRMTTKREPRIEPPWRGDTGR